MQPELGAGDRMRLRGLAPSKSSHNTKAQAPADLHQSLRYLDRHDGLCGKLALLAERMENDRSPGRKRPGRL